MGGQFFKIGVIGTVDGPLHIGLTRADPDLTHEDIGEFERILAQHLEDVGAACGEGIKFDLPLTNRFGSGGMALAGDPDCDDLALVGPTPDRVGLIPLQYHVITKQCWHADIGSAEGYESRADERTDENEQSGIMIEWPRISEGLIHGVWDRWVWMVFCDQL